MLALADLASALTAKGISPENRASEVCVDTPIRITFGAPPTLGTSGKIVLMEADGTVADTIDLSLNSSGGTQPRTIGGTRYNTFPVLVSENTATVFPNPGVLKHDTTYHITVEADVFPGFTGVPTPGKWSFRTKARKPSKRTATLTVDAAGGGDFVTIQGAVDFLPKDNTSPRAINIRNGIYQEIVRVNSKHNISFRGEDRKRTVISYPNNNNINPGSNTRTMFNVAANGISFTNLTLSNSTPKGGSQAEALRVNGQRCLVDHCDLHSYQDTFLINNVTDTAYLVDSFIEGDVDFIWGYGRVVFQRCEIKSLNSGYICQMRNPAGQCGAVFLDCRFTRAADVTKVYLNRIDPNVFPYSAVALVACAVDEHIIPAGWLLDNGTAALGVSFQEFKSTKLAGKPLDVSGRAAFSRQITAEEAAELRDLAKTLGGWSPASGK